LLKLLFKRLNCPLILIDALALGVLMLFDVIYLPLYSAQIGAGGIVG